MKVSLNWAREYTEIDLPMKELVQLATERLGGIEDFEDISKHYEGVVVAKIVSAVQHPNADRLKLCKINDGGTVTDVERDSNGYVQVVCAAPNVREGLVVAWIPPKAVVPASYGDKELFVLEARELRGQVSNGMLASPRELGMNDDHSSILEISDDVALGTPFKQLYELDDIVLAIENKMFTHRPDCFGQLGVARELAGIQHKQFHSPEWYTKSTVEIETPSSPSAQLTVTNEVPELCPRFMAVVLENVTIEPSPLWMQTFLKRVGIRPINNVVDITNYIMVLTAKPMHAFDFDKIAKNNQADIAIRKPRNGETMTLLGGKEITPYEDAVLICDSSGPISLGGVMGGNNSEIDKNTTRIVIENATFDMYNIRKTSMVHGIFTDALTRFNKGQPAGQLVPAMNKTLELLRELTGATVASELVDSYAVPQEAHTVIVATDFINSRLGSELSAEKIVSLLENVEFNVEQSEDSLHVTAPFWRTDIEINEDIVEEVGRMYGFNQLPSALPRRDITPVKPDALRSLKQELRRILCRAGANEVLTYSFVHGDTLKKANQKPEQAFALRNALSPDLQYFRLSLLPSLLDRVHANIKMGYDEFTLFEIGKGHNKAVIDEESGIPDEINNLEMVYTSAEPKEGAAYYQMLRTVEYTLTQLGIQYRLEPLDEGWQETASKMQATAPYDPKRMVNIFNATERGGYIGCVGELRESVVKGFKLPKYTAAALLSIDGPSFYEENRDINEVYTPLSKYPQTSQDITFKTDISVPFSEIQGHIKACLKDVPMQWELETLSIFQPKDSSTKNTSFRLTLSHFERTLTTKEVSKLVKDISWQLHQTINAELV
jgi:phenylalanyl-tRNA synthetase beta chain